MSGIEMNLQDEAGQVFSLKMRKNWVCNCLSLFNQFPEFIQRNVRGMSTEKEKKLQVRA
jgi:hypothetical protein